MRLNNKWSVALVFLLFCLIPIKSQDYHDSISNILKTYYKNQETGIVALVMDNKDVLYKQGFGMADIEEQEPVKSNTNFNLSGMSQLFTATGILMLSDQGVLELDEPIGPLLDLPDYCDQITISHLLRHSSGLPHIDTKKILADKSVTLTNELIIDSLKATNEPLFKSGRKLQINQVNYILLASVIEKKYGKDFRKFMKKEIFKPLDMDDARVYAREKDLRRIKNRAIGYIPDQDDGGYKEDPRIKRNLLQGYGNIYCSIDDYVKWIEAWQKSTLLSKESYKLASRMNYWPGYSVFTGYGWFNSFNTGKRYDYQVGSGFGFTNILLKSPGKHLYVVLLTNYAGSFNLRKKAFEIINLYVDEDYQLK